MAAVIASLNIDAGADSNTVDLAVMDEIGVLCLSVGNGRWIAMDVGWHR